MGIIRYVETMNNPSIVYEIGCVVETLWQFLVNWFKDGAKEKLEPQINFQFFSNLVLHRECLEVLVVTSPGMQVVCCCAHDCGGKDRPLD